MISQITLYPRGKSLKNLLSEWHKEYPTIARILVEWDYANNIPIVKDLDEVEQLLYDSVIEHWYFADIGFDSNYEFIYRFNAVWNINIHKYKKLIELQNKVGLLGELREKNNTNENSSNNTITKTGSKAVSHTTSGTETMQKGVTTTSSQSTSNEGNKLARTTPNEQLIVEGSNQTTVTDSGQDMNTRSSTESVTETPNLTDTHEYESEASFNETDSVVKLSATDYELMLKLKSITLSFALCFEKLFMEVFD